jgi:hypothetical protein
LATRTGIDLDTLLALGVVPDALNASADAQLLPWQAEVLDKMNFAKFQ